MPFVIAAEHLASIIANTGARTVFGLAGATHAPLLFALEDRGISIVGGRHESGTVGAADGYARRSGKTGFACIVGEQGLPNAMTALMTAAQAETPLVVIATRFPDSWMEADAQYIVDRHELTAPFLKFSRTVPSPDRAGEYLQAAIRAAREGVPGPALLVLPMDFLSAESGDKTAPAANETNLPAASDDMIAAAAQALAGASKPIVVTDNRAAESDCSDALQQLAAMGIPVLGNGLGRGLAPEAAPGGYPWPYAQLAASQADLVLIVGARMNMWFGYGKAPRFAGDARFIHLDSCSQAIGRNRPVDIAIHADPGSTLDALASQLAQDGYRRDASWLAGGLSGREQRIADLLAEYGDRLHAASIGDALNRLLPDDRVLVCDGADSMNFTHACMRVHRPRSYADLLPFGAMGAGFPVAIGMAAAEREIALAEDRRPAPVALVTGDGSLGFFLAELDTAARSGLPLMVLVSNDGKWGTEFHGQEAAFSRTINTDLGVSDYSAIAAAFGCDAAIAHTRTQLDAAISSALKTGNPTLIDVRVDPLGGRVRKQDPLLSMILFEDIAQDE